MNGSNVQGVDVLFRLKTFLGVFEATRPENISIRLLHPTNYLTMFGLLYLNWSL